VGVGEMEEIIIFSGITIISFILMIIALLSYRHYRSKKLMLLGFGFLFFFIRGVLLSLSLFNSQIQEFTTSNYIWVFDLIILLILYITSLKR
jgi:hypothetical protein